MFFLSLISALVIGIVLFMVVMDIVKYRRLTRRDELSFKTKSVACHIADAERGV